MPNLYRLLLRYLKTALRQIPATSVRLKHRQDDCVVRRDRQVVDKAVALAGDCGPGNDKTWKIRPNITLSTFIRDPGFPPTNREPDPLFMFHFSTEQNQPFNRLFQDPSIQ